MCLSIAIARPDDVLAKGHHAGFEWNVVHNGIGHRCGYVRLPKGHPWYKADYDEIRLADGEWPDVHGGLTFTEADVHCGKDGADDGWWIGFDAAHSGDAADPSLSRREGMFLMGISGDVIRTQEYMEAECRKLCEQAASVR